MIHDLKADPKDANRNVAIGKVIDTMEALWNGEYDSGCSGPPLSQWMAGVGKSNCSIRIIAKPVSINGVKIFHPIVSLSFHNS